MKKEHPGSDLRRRARRAPTSKTGCRCAVAASRHVLHLHVVCRAGGNRTRQEQTTQKVGYSDGFLALRADARGLRRRGRRRRCCGGRTRASSRTPRRWPTSCSLVTRDVSRASSSVGPTESTIPVDVRHGRLWPEKPLVPGEPLTVELTVRRPGWAGWLVGRTARASLVVRTPSARLRGRWLEVRPGEPVVATFDTPVRTVVLRVHGRARTLRFARARTTVDVGVVAAGQQQAGSISVSAVPRTWERMPEADSVELVPGSAPGAGARRARRRRGSGSRPRDHAHLLPPGADDLRNEPADDHPARARPLAPARHPYALPSRPGGLGYPLGSHVAVRLPEPVGLAQAAGGRQHPHAHVGRASRDDLASPAASRPGGLPPAFAGARPPIR